LPIINVSLSDEGAKAVVGPDGSGWRWGMSACFDDSEAAEGGMKTAEDWLFARIIRYTNRSEGYYAEIQS